jgi:hypothetical protein
MAGYSGTPLVKKLGIKAGHRVLLFQAPAAFALAELPEGVAVHATAAGGPYDVILAFAPRRADLDRHFTALARKLKPTGGLWIAWPKKASGVATDLTEDVVRAVGLEAGLVDNKVCAIDEVWSGLRFVVRVYDRPAKKK